MGEVGTGMEQFVVVAAAHLGALLIPGVDFLLIVRMAASRGWQIASGACVGIAAANAAFVVAAFGGIALVSEPVVLQVVRGVGGLFLLWVGIAFLRADARIGPEAMAEATAEVTSGDKAGAVAGASASGALEARGGTTWWSSTGLGLASGLLNPKNALFYVSLAAVVGTRPGPVLAAYGIWMVAVVLAWDLIVAATFGSAGSRARLDRALPWITRASGAVILGLGLAMLLEMAVAQT